MQGVLQQSHGSAIAVPWPCHRWVAAVPRQYDSPQHRHDQAMAVLWQSILPRLCHSSPWCHGCAAAMPWRCHGKAMAVPWQGHGSAMAVLRGCHGIRMPVQWWCQGGARQCHRIAMAVPLPCRCPGSYGNAMAMEIGSWAQGPRPRPLSRKHPPQGCNKMSRCGECLAKLLEELLNIWQTFERCFSDKCCNHM